MTCPEFRRLVDALPLRLRREQERVALRTHVATCDRCSAWLAAAEAIERDLATLPAPAISGDLAAGVLGRIGDRRPEVAATRPARTAPRPAIGDRGRFTWAAMGGILAAAGSVAAVSPAGWVATLWRPELGLGTGVVAGWQSPTAATLATATGVIMLAISVLSAPPASGAHRVRPALEG